MIFLDFSLLIMTITCVIYCFILNRRIQDLQDSKIEFARMIKELNVSTIKAENNVHEMSKVAQDTSTEINSSIEDAKKSTLDLTHILDKADDLFNKMQIQEKKLQQSFNNRESSYEAIHSKASEKFTDEDFVPSTKENEESTYVDYLKDFIDKIVIQRSEENKQSNNKMQHKRDLEPNHDRQSEIQSHTHTEHIPKTEYNKKENELASDPKKELHEALASSSGQSSYYDTLRKINTRH